MACEQEALDYTAALQVLNQAITNLNTASANLDSAQSDYNDAESNYNAAVEAADLAQSNYEMCMNMNPEPAPELRKASRARKK